MAAYCGTSHLEIENVGRFKKKTFYDKRDNFTLKKINSPFISSNIPAAPAYGVFIQNNSVF